MRASAVLSCLSLISVSATGLAAFEATCNQGKVVRKLRVVYEDSTKMVPCAVLYKKETEAPTAEDQVLWSSKNTKGYCDEKADAFVKKLEGMGWTCTKGGAEAPAADAAKPAEGAKP